MHLQPNTKLFRLLAAIPSARVVCERFHMPLIGNGDKSLEQLCGEAGITFANFLRVLDDLDWEEDYRAESAGDS